ncbi:MAG: pilus assembly protein N-terminal domain-containing protein [Planctomycetota bacterium]
MEMFRNAVSSAAIKLTALLSVACLSTQVGAQEFGGDMLTSAPAASAVNHTVTRPVERLEMLVKSNTILTLEGQIPRFQVQNEEVLGATPISVNQLQVFAKTPGTTQINLWDTNDKQYAVDITVIADAREIEGVLAAQLPLATLKVMPVNASAIVSGYVTSVDDVDRAISIVEQYYPTVVNNIRVVGVQQVLLHTRIMEVSRTKLRKLGVDISWTDGVESFASAPIPLSPASVTNIFSGEEFLILIDALRSHDLIKYLAEPTVVATHGRPARFIVGGRVPYIVPSGNGQVTINYEEFGTAVDFLPFVVGPGRVRLEVRPEVSEVDESRSLILGETNVPGFSQRYVETAVELQAGQTFAIAGLLQSRTEGRTRSIPLLGELPIFGTMFRNIQEERNDVELLITVTPELVDAMDPHQVPRNLPGLNSMSPNDRDLYIHGHLEVPNLLGGDGCSMESGNNRTATENMLHQNVMQHGAMMSRGNLMTNTMGLPPGATVQGGGVPPGVIPGNVIPDGAVVPGSEPTVVGEGVILSTPEGY